MQINFKRTSPINVELNETVRTYLSKSFKETVDKIPVRHGTRLERGSQSYSEWCMNDTQQCLHFQLKCYRILHSCLSKQQFNVNAKLDYNTNSGLHQSVTLYLYCLPSSEQICNFLTIHIFKYNHYIMAACVKCITSTLMSKTLIQQTDKFQRNSY